MKPVNGTIARGNVPYEYADTTQVMRKLNLI
jgi:hypothetical protein